MLKISLATFEKMMQYDVVKNKACIEIEFSVDEDPIYFACCLGKMFDGETNRGLYWYGLVADGSQAYDYDTLEAFLNAKILNGNSIKQLWSKISLFSIDACSVEERLPFYLGITDGSRMRPAL